MTLAGKPRVSIEYCPRCGWLLRAAWLAQEVLTSFDQDVSAVELVPSPVSGTFRVKVGDRVAFIGIGKRFF